MELQNKFNRERVIYKITKDIDLESNTLTIPNGCTLDFQGGKFINGTINLNNTRILPNGCIITDYITSNITGTYKIGQCLFDITLYKPKWWTGSKWVDSTGADV